MSLRWQHGILKVLWEGSRNRGLVGNKQLPAQPFRLVQQATFLLKCSICCHFLSVFSSWHLLPDPCMRKSLSLVEYRAGCHLSCRRYSWYVPCHLSAALKTHPGWQHRCGDCECMAYGSNTSHICHPTRRFVIWLSTLKRDYFPPW